LTKEACGSQERKNGCEKTGEKTGFSPENAGFREGKKQFGAARPGFVQNHEGASC
jgi:hypothetical protein